MKTLLHAWARLKRLKWREIRHLMVLCVTAVCLGFALTCLEIGASAQLLQKEELLNIGVDYLIVAIAWILFGSQALQLDRRKGYGSCIIAVVLTAIWGCVLFWMNQTDSSISMNVAFVLKYGTVFVMNIAFWALAARYIKLSMTSLKFKGLFGAETMGMALGSLVAIQNRNCLETILWGVWGLLGCALLFRVLGVILRVPRETFIKKVGGVQDISEKIVADVILIISFVWVFVRVLTEYQVYANIVQNNWNPGEVLGWVFVAFAMGVLISLTILSRTRFLYTTPLGLMVCALSACVCATGNILDFKWIVYVAAVLFMITSHLYMRRYLSLLPRPLGLGTGIRLKKLRWLMTMPCAFLLAGACLLTIQSVVVWLLLVAGFVLAALFIWSSYLYGRQLMKMCALRIWRGGPLMLVYSPLKQMVRQGLSKPNAAEAIYFLNILNEGYTAEYRHLLVQMLEHPAVSVRLFVLKKMAKLGLILREKRRLSELMKSDSCDEVRNMALSLLISDALESNSHTAWHKYKDYLDQTEWVWGACDGFLSGRGAWIDKVVEKVLKLAESSKEKDNLIALSIMTAHPRQAWVAPVGQLLNTPHLSVMKAALVAAGKLASPVLLNRLLPLLDEIRWRDHVLETLNEYGKQAFPAIEKMLLSDSAPIDRQKELILFLGRLPSGEGKQILLRTLFGVKRILRLSIIESLEDAEIVWVHQDRKKVLKKAIRSSAKEWQEMQQMLIQAENLESTKLIKIKQLFVRAIVEEMDRTRNLVLELLKLYSLAPLAQKALETLKGNDLNAYAGAVSCLQDILPSKIYTEVRPILLYPTTKEPPIQLEKMPVSAFLNSFILNPFEWTNTWLQVLSLYAWRELGDPAGLVAVKEGLKASDWSVLEAALSALGRLEKDKSKVEEMALTVPTRYLLKQNFENLLEDKHVSNH